MKTQEWECTILMPDKSTRTVVVTATPPMAQASAEVSALKQLGYDRHKTSNPSCIRSRFVRECPTELSK